MPNPLIVKKTNFHSIVWNSRNAYENLIFNLPLFPKLLLQNNFSIDKAPIKISQTSNGYMRRNVDVLITFTNEV